MKKLVFFPGDPIEAYYEVGYSEKKLENYYNPAAFFDEAYCLSPWEGPDYIGDIQCIKADTKQFKRIIRDIHPNVVRGYGGHWCADWVSISKVKDIPTVVSVHDTNPELLFPSVRFADHIICVSNAVRDEVIKKVGNSNGHIIVMPNRVDTEKFSPRKNETFFKENKERFGTGKYILHVGRKIEQKNLDTLIRSLAKLPSKFKCIFIGRGDDAEYKILAQELKVSDRCFWIESVDNDKLPEWFSWCDCMCTPSRWEGFGIVFIEAAACGACIVTSDLPPMNEFLKHNDNAFLVKDYESPEALASAISFATSKNPKIDLIKKNARDMSLQFDSKVIDQIEANFYDAVINGRANNKTNWKLLVRQYI